MSETLKRGFYQYSKAWYRNEAWYKDNVIQPDVLDDFTIGYYAVDENGKGHGCKDGEFSIKFKKLGERFVPQLQIFDDAFPVLNKCVDLVDSLSELGEGSTPDDIREILLDLGFQDLTETER